MARLQASEGRKGENAKNIEKTNENQRCWPLGALLGGLLEASWGVLEASWAVWRPSWASWNDFSATRGPLGPSWRSLGALVARFEALDAPPAEFLERMTPPAGPADPGRPPLQIDRTGLPGEGFGEGEASHTPMNPKGSADFPAQQSTPRLIVESNALPPPNLPTLPKSRRRGSWRRPPCKLCPARAGNSIP